MQKVKLYTLFFIPNNSKWGVQEKIGKLYEIENLNPSFKKIAYVRLTIDSAVNIFVVMIVIKLTFL